MFWNPKSHKLDRIEQWAKSSVIKNKREICEVDLSSRKLATQTQEGWADCKSTEKVKQVISYIQASLAEGKTRTVSIQRGCPFLICKKVP